MRFVLMLALLGPMVGLHWLLEVEDGAHVVAVPRDQKSGVILLGRYQGEGEQAQIVRPADVVPICSGWTYGVLAARS